MASRDRSVPAVPSDHGPVVAHLGGVVTGVTPYRAGGAVMTRLHPVAADRRWLHAELFDMRVDAAPLRQTGPGPSCFSAAVGGTGWL